MLRRGITVVTDTLDGSRRGRRSDSFPIPTVRSRSRSCRSRTALASSEVVVTLFSGEEDDDVARCAKRTGACSSSVARCAKRSGAWLSASTRHKVLGCCSFRNQLCCVLGTPYEVEHLTVDRTPVTRRTYLRGSYFRTYRKSLHSISTHTFPARFSSSR